MALILLTVHTPDGRRWHVGARTGDFAGLVNNHAMQVPVGDIECASATGEVLIESVKWIIDSNEVNDGG